MRIVVLTTSFPRTPEDPSGHFVRASALRLVAAGHQVHVVAPGGSPWSAPVRSRDRRPGGGSLWVHDAGGGSLFGWPGALARLREAPWRIAGAGVLFGGALARLRSIGAVDRVVAHWIVPCAFPLATAVHAPLDVVAHGADVRLLVGLPRDVRERVMAHLVGRGARFTFAASSLLESLEKSLGPDLAARLAASAHVEPPAIDVPDVSERAAALRSSLALADDQALVVTASRLVGSKRVELAIDAVRAMRSRARLVVVGDGPERAALGQRAADLGTTVAFTGALPRREALAWVAAADVVVHPSGVEAAPSVVREARALGVNVVACASGDIVAWAHDDVGIRVVEPRADAIAEAIASALGRPG